MADPLRKSEESPESSGDAAENDRQLPAEAEPNDAETEPQTTLGEDIRARIKHVHKGDVGMPGTNEEVFQGWKERELL
ncbi:MAG TPA: hypothetical protein VHZ25_17590 [Acidobacteriaceae bacterium]|jgi:hypothetical protein|nr:hypothetical protein [Acidobacteriaceae bacterium]